MNTGLPEAMLLDVQDFHNTKISNNISSKNSNSKYDYFFFLYILFPYNPHVTLRWSVTFRVGEFEYKQGKCIFNSCLLFRSSVQTYDRSKHPKFNFFKKRTWNTRHIKANSHHGAIHSKTNKDVCEAEFKKLLEIVCCTIFCQ